MIEKGSVRSFFQLLIGAYNCLHERIRLSQRPSSISNLGFRISNLSKRSNSTLILRDLIAREGNGRDWLATTIGLLILTPTGLSRWCRCSSIGTPACWALERYSAVQISVLSVCLAKPNPCQQEDGILVSHRAIFIMNITETDIDKIYRMLRILAFRYLSQSSQRTQRSQNQTMSSGAGIKGSLKDSVGST